MAVVELHDVVLLGVVSLVHAWQFGTFLIICNRFFISTPDMRQSKTLLTIDESCARNSVFDWQSKTLFLAIFDPRSLTVSISINVFDCRLSDVILKRSYPAFNSVNTLKCIIII